jgi:hypothetical protein
MRSAMRNVSRVFLAGAVVVAAVCCCAGASAQTAGEALADTPRSERSAALELQIYPLPGGGEIRHDRYAGIVRRLDRDLKEVLRGKVPAEKPGLLESGRFLKFTTLVLSSNGARLLVIHNDDLMHYPPGHKVLLLDVATLKPVAQWPLGDCDRPYTRLPRQASRLTLVCQASRPPAEPKREPTFALVTLDLDRGEVVRWFPLEGGRHGQWFGPMFFGYIYDATLVTIEQRPGGCPSEPVVAPANAPGPGEYPELVLVVERRKGETKGEVWFVSPGTTVEPRRVAALSATPTAAFVCGGGGKLLLHVTAEQTAAAPSGQAPTAGPTARIVEVFDLLTGARVGG